jgi:hypothetical protein
MSHFSIPFHELRKVMGTGENTIPVPLFALKSLRGICNPRCRTSDRRYQARTNIGAADNPKNRQHAVQRFGMIAADVGNISYGRERPHPCSSAQGPFVGLAGAQHDVLGRTVLDIFMMILRELSFDLSSMTMISWLNPARSALVIKSSILWRAGL